MKIGFFDSGIGGLSVLHLAAQQLPEAQFIYYADKSNVPYGEKTKQQIVKYTDRAVQFLMEKGAQAIVIACNTATSAAISTLRKRYSLPIIGMEPAIKKAIDTFDDKRILAAATPVTVKGEKMQRLIERTDSDHRVDLVALPRLVHFAENGEFRSGDVTKYLEEELAAFPFAEYSSLVLGCTHFNYFKDSFREILPYSIKFVDGNMGTVSRLINQLNFIDEAGNEHGPMEFYYSGLPVTDKTELSRLQGYLLRLDEMLSVG